VNADTSDDVVTVGTAARRLGVSVRTLHHWDNIGVASPSGRTAGGYRAYRPGDIARLRRVLLFRELGMTLEEIPALLDAGADVRRAELERRRAELVEKIHHLETLTAGIDRLLAADTEGVLLSPAEQAEVFGEQWDPAWSASARQQWGDTAQWAEYSERSAGRTANEWREVATSVDDVTSALATAKRDGVAPGSTEANFLAERHRAAMSEYFHCTLSMHVLIAHRYVDEPEFAESFNRLEPGLSLWVKQVIDANALAQRVVPESAQWH
jgi:DNA-binding transcriptional MerR regulator